MRRKDRVKVQVWAGSVTPQPKRLSWKTVLLTSGLLFSAIGLVTGGGWLAVQLIVNPSALGWLSQVLPAWPDLATPPRTLDQIGAEIAETGRWIDQPIYFNPPGVNQQTAQAMLLPVLRPRNHCPEGTNQAGSGRCGEVVELRVYRFKYAAPRFGRATKGVTYELVDRINVSGPEELSAIASLTQAEITQGTTRTLPLTTLQAIDGKAPTADLWFHLSGEWKRGTRVLYGKVIRYDPQQQRLHSMQNWSSPAGQLPYWQQITGSDAAELVVNQSLGLEPQFRVYQLKLAQSVVQSATLEAISLTEASLSDRTYVHGLLLARKGLWSPAQLLLQTVKQKGKWSATTQAQLDLIGLHAKVTQTQAERDWASPMQQILAQLIDGRWSQALNALKSAHTSGYDVRNLIGANVDRLWPRVEIALRVNNRQADLQQWSVLILTVKQSRQQAIAWLKKQSIPVAPLDQTLALLEPTPAPALKLPPVPTPITPVVMPSRPPSSVVGAVTVLKTPDASWTPIANSSLNLPSGQRWYQIQVMELHDGQSWQRSPFTIQLEGLGNLSLQIVAWQGATQAQTITTTVKATRFSNGQLFLLTAAPPLPSANAVMAITPNSMNWIEPLASATLNQLAQAQPAWETALTTLWQDLQTAQLVSSSAPDAATISQTIGNWTIQKMELTGDSQPEVVLTIQVADAQPPRTVIFSDQSKVMYSDLKTTQSVVAMLNRTLAPAPTLIVLGQQGLQLQQWSSQNQRFE